jgi:predicted Zn-dependent protease
VAPPAELFPAWLEALDKSGNDERALQIAEAMRAARPKDELPLRLVIDLAVRAGRTADVVAAREALLALAPDDVGRDIDLAGALTSAGKPLEAERRLIALQKQKPGWKSPELMLELGRAWADRDPVKARGLMRDSLTLQARPHAYAVLGELERKQGRLEEAADAFKKALDLDPSLLEVRYGLVRLMIQRGQTNEATAELRRLIAADPRDVRAREMLGDALLELGDARAAAGAFQGAIDSGGEQAGVLMKLAKLQLQQLEQVGPAVKSLRKAIKSDPKLAEPHYYLGLALKDQGKTPEARSELRTYLTLAPKGEYADDAKRAVDDLERMP